VVVQRAYLSTLTGEGPCHSSIGYRITMPVMSLR
jgi:hypothetical protein